MFSIRKGQTHYGGVIYAQLVRCVKWNQIESDTWLKTVTTLYYGKIYGYRVNQFATNFRFFLTWLWINTQLLRTKCHSLVYCRTGGGLTLIDVVSDVHCAGVIKWLLDECKGFKVKGFFFIRKVNGCIQSSVLLKIVLFR